jgi:hypothetical protein
MFLQVSIKFSDTEAREGSKKNESTYCATETDRWLLQNAKTASPLVVRVSRQTTSPSTRR